MNDAPETPEPVAYACPACGSERMQEVGSVVTTTPVEIVADENGRPRFVDYTDAGSEAIWDCSDSDSIECAECCTVLDSVEDFEPTREPQLSVRAIELAVLAVGDLSAGDDESEIENLNAHAELTRLCRFRGGTLAL